MISILFASHDSVYKLIPGVDVWDEDRNALRWPGGNPGIFHPPCRLFSMLRNFSTAPQNEKKLAYWSVDTVRENGGVLEHPAFSTLWNETNLPTPGNNDDYGFSIQVDQFWFGTPSRKRTWLYVCGIQKPLPPHPIKLAGTYDPVFTGHGRKEPATQRHFRSATTLEFAHWLIAVAQRVEQSKCNLPN